MSDSRPPSAFGPVLFAGLTIYTIVTQPGSSDDGNPHAKTLVNAPEAASFTQEKPIPPVAPAVMLVQNLWPSVSGPTQPGEEVIFAGLPAIPAPVIFIPHKLEPPAVTTSSSASLPPQVPGPSYATDITSLKMHYRDVLPWAREWLSLRVTSAFLNMRSGPGIEHPVTFNLTYGTIVDYSQKRGSWAKVIAREGRDSEISGWINMDYTLPEMAP